MADYFANFPAELIEKIFWHLSGLDLVWMSHVNCRMYNVANSNAFWDNALEAECLKISTLVQKEAKHICTEIESTRNEGTELYPPSLSKIGYLLCRRVRKNIGRSNYKEGMVLHYAPDQALVGISDDYLVSMEEKKIRAWDISGRWTTLISSASVVKDPLHTPYQILVVKHLAIVCSTFGDEEEEDNLDDTEENQTYQIIQAFDLTNNLTLVWKKTDLLGTHFHYISSVDDRIMIIDKLRETIEICDAGLDGLSTQVILEQPRHSMRILNSTLSLNQQYLVVAGSLVPENIPVISCWDIQSRARQVLRSFRPICPFRWFKKTALSKDTVFGLLNRFRLMAWDPVSTNTKFSIDLTDSSPGDDEACAAWLTLDLEFVLTVHQDKSCVSVLSTDGIHLGSIRPLLPTPSEEENAQHAVEQVTIRGYTAVIRIISETSSSTSCRIVTADLTPFLTALENRRNGSPEAICLIAYVAAEHSLNYENAASTECCYLYFNTTKIFDLQSVGCRFYDYLYLGERFPDRVQCQH